MCVIIVNGPRYPNETFPKRKKYDFGNFLLALLYASTPVKWGNHKTKDIASQREAHIMLFSGPGESVEIAVK